MNFMLTLYLSLVDSDEDKEKVTYIYENFYSLMSYSAGKYLKNKYDIEDIVHNSIIKIIENLELIDMHDIKRVKSLCCIIAKNKAIDFCRAKENKNSSMEEYITEGHLDDEDPCDIVVSKDTYDIILKSINSLNDTYKDVCILKYVNGLKEREIASLLDLSPKTVSLRIYRGKKILREALRKENLYV